ncbi:MAG: pitrilysin family protein [Cyanobacteria bacterium J06628_6]
MSDSSLAAFPATVVRLDNGLTVIHQEIAATPVVVVDVWVNAGAGREPDAWLGMAHFLEHMVFKGTDRLLPGMFDQAIESRGGLTNAATSHDYAHFYMTLAADTLPDALPYLADLLLHPAIPVDEFWRERQVVLEEILQANDDPDWLGYQAFSQLLYGSHPYGRSVLGTPDILNQCSPEEMRQFHQAHYQPENISVVIAGGVALDLTLELVQHAFRPFAQPTQCPQIAPQPVHRLDRVRREAMALPQLQHGRLMMAWLAPGVDDLQAACGLDLLATLLAGGRAARLVQELQEERQWVLEVDGSFSLQRDCSLFGLTFWLAPERVLEVEQVVCDRMAELAAQPVTEAELIRCQRLLCNDYAFSTETPGQIAGLYGYYGTIAQPELSVAYPDLIRTHTAATLQQLADQYLSPERYAAMVLEPVP